MGKEYDIACGWHLERFSFRYEYFAFFDTADYLADNLFVKHEVKVDFGPEFERDDSPYKAIFCRCRKRDVSRFLKALEELPNKMMICGYTDYPQFCEKIKHDAIDAMEVIRKGGNRDGTDGSIRKTEQKETEGVL